MFVVGWFCVCFLGLCWVVFFGVWWVCGFGFVSGGLFMGGGFWLFGFGFVLNTVWVGFGWVVGLLIGCGVFCLVVLFG